MIEVKDKRKHIEALGHRERRSTCPSARFPAVFVPAPGVGLHPASSNIGADEPGRKGEMS
jgi:hypothetical protein